MDKPTENALAVIGPSKSKPGDQPLPVDAPAMDAPAEPVTIDLTAIETRMDAPNAGANEPNANSGRTSADALGALWQKFSPLAASIAVAVLVGAIAGAAATTALAPIAPAEPPAAASIPEDTRLQDRVAKLSSELAALKSGIEAANRTATHQFNRIGERLDRAEKAQTEPAARLARISESLDRLERRTASAALPPPDATGSVTSIEKQQSKPPALEGWRLRDFYAGRAVLESRTGTLFEVGPGSNLPGVGKVETIKRIDGKIVITTPKGTITSWLEPPRRPQYYLPQGY